MPTRITACPVAAGNALSLVQTSLAQLPPRRRHPVQALGFVLERHLPSYAGNLPDNILSQVLASATGRYGTTRDYVEQTANCLRSHAMPDLNLEAKLKRCGQSAETRVA